MSYCKNCGKENTDTAKFCTGCGDSLSILIYKNAANQSVNYKKRITLIITSLIVVSAAIYFLFIQNSSKGIEKGKSATEEILNSNQNIQPFVAKSSYPQPQELVYSENQKNEGYPNSLYPNFFPIGWSRDGKFAYAEEPVDEACGCYFLNIYIQDMYSDKMVWSWRVELNEEQSYNPEKGNIFYFKKNWNNNNALFTQKLNQYQIEPITFSNLEKLPLQIADNDYNFRITNNSFYEQGSDQQVIGSTSIALIVNGIEKKKIFKKKYSDVFEGHNYSITLSNRILGYFKSPYENRIAVFLLTENKGYEGIPTVMNFDIIGCDLNNVR